MWWQFLAYGILTAGEVLVSITALEFSYKQAPLSIKSFIMSLFLLSTSLGNFGIAAVNNLMVRPLVATAVESGSETWVKLSSVDGFVVGQKLDLTGATGLTRQTTKDGALVEEPVQGTFLISQIEQATSRVRLMDNVSRKPIATTGTFDLQKGVVSTYWLVGPYYFLFFIAVMCFFGVIFIFVAQRYQERTHVRVEAAAA
jgi:POT family proton-dependent oligopeptide transporter